jgi:hypothetical protein
MDGALVGAGSLWLARPIVLAAFMGEMDPLQAPCVCVCVCVCVCGIQRLLLNPKGDKSAIWCRIMAALSALPCFEVPSYHEGGHGSPSENLGARVLGLKNMGKSQESRHYSL